MKTLSKASRRLLKAYDRGYRIRQNGSIMSPRGKEISGWIDNKGYRSFSVKVSSGNNAVPVHRMVALQKFGASRLLEGDVVVRHLDGNPLNNSWVNIEIGSQSDNLMDRPPGERLAHAIKASKSRSDLISHSTLEQVAKDRETGMTYPQLSKKYGLPKSTLSYYFGKNCKRKSLLWKPQQKETQQ